MWGQLLSMTHSLVFTWNDILCCWSNLSSTWASICFLPSGCVTWILRISGSKEWPCLGIRWAPKEGAKILSPKIQSHSQREPKEGTNQPQVPSRQKAKNSYAGCLQQEGSSLSLWEKGSVGMGLDLEGWDNVKFYYPLWIKHCRQRDLEGANSANGLYPSLYSASFCRTPSAGPGLY